LGTVDGLLKWLPPGVAHHEGFSGSIHLVKRLGENLGLELEAIAVGNRPPPENRLPHAVLRDRLNHYSSCQTASRPVETSERSIGNDHRWRSSDDRL